MKSNLHKRNLHREGYDFDVLKKVLPDLAHFIFQNKYGSTTIDFHNPEAVTALNKALLLQYYNMKHWDLPKGNLCPPVPGRSDYIHYAADLLASSNIQSIPKGKNISILDIGTGSSLIYPILGHALYQWTFIASDISLRSLEHAQSILDLNPPLKENISLKHQKYSDKIFQNIIEDVLIDLTLCNPPFFASRQEAQEANRQKSRNLTGTFSASSPTNFGGHDHELWCTGGERYFISKMIQESASFKNSVFWFTCLVSNKKNLPHLHNELSSVKPIQTKTINMSQGQKESRFIAWTFLTPKQQKLWAQARWNLRNS